MSLKSKLISLIKKSQLAEDFNYSATMRNLKKESPEKIKPFMIAFKDAFDSAKNQELDGAENIALMEAVKNIQDINKKAGLFDEVTNNIHNQQSWVWESPEFYQICFYKLINGKDPKIEKPYYRKDDENTKDEIKFYDDENQEFDRNSYKTQLKINSRIKDMYYLEDLNYDLWPMGVPDYTDLQKDAADIISEFENALKTRKASTVLNEKDKGYLKSFLLALKTFIRIQDTPFYKKIYIKELSVISGKSESFLKNYMIKEINEKKDNSGAKDFKQNWIKLINNYYMKDNEHSLTKNILNFIHGYDFFNTSSNDILNNAASIFYNETGIKMPISLHMNVINVLLSLYYQKKFDNILKSLEQGFFIKTHHGKFYETGIT